MLSTSLIKNSRYKPFSRFVRALKINIATRFQVEKLCVEDAPSFKPEYEYLFQQLVSDQMGIADPMINVINKHINFELFSFGVMHCTKSVSLGGSIRFNKFGLFEPGDEVTELEVSVCHEMSYRVSGLTLSLILSHFVWQQMINHKRNVRFAKYMLERIQIAYGYILRSQPELVNSYIYTQFKMNIR